METPRSVNIVPLKKLTSNAYLDDGSHSNGDELCLEEIKYFTIFSSMTGNVFAHVFSENEEGPFRCNQH